MPIFSIVKTVCVLAIAGITALKAPVVMPVLFNAQPTIVFQRSTPERLATMEEKVEMQERRLDNFEHDRIGERLAKLEQLQEVLFMLGIPVAVYMTTHTIEIWRRPRAKSREESADEIAERVLEKLLEARGERAAAAGG